VKLLEPWSTQPIVVIDFETTGPDPATCEPVEIGLVRFEGRKEVASWSTLIRPSGPIPAEASEIHGITDAMVAGMPEAALVCPPAELFADAIPCAYNESFDRLVAARTIPSLPDSIRRANTWLDPYVMVGLLDKFASGKGRHKLARACERRGIELIGAHRAEGDCRATGELLFACANELKNGRGIDGVKLIDVLWRQSVLKADRDRDFLTWLAKQPPLEEAA
jgi:DNA polymerase III epsilon subunit-like protein